MSGKKSGNVFRRFIKIAVKFEVFSAMHSHEASLHSNVYQSNPGSPDELNTRKQLRHCRRIKSTV